MCIIANLQSESYFLDLLLWVRLTLSYFILGDLSWQAFEDVTLIWIVDQEVGATS